MYPMKKRSYLLLFVVAFTGAFLLGGCLNEENKIPPNCYDGLLNNGEEQIDCGGPLCDQCDPCTNGRKDEGEVWVDCGGECDVCPPCANGVLDLGEVAIDCGPDCGPCSALCGDGLLNGDEEELDCGGNPLYCAACPTCIDDIMNGSEVGIDCGGTECDPCPVDGSCTNGFMEAYEYWTDCGGPTCPSCDTLLQWKVGTADNIVLPLSVTGTINGTTLTINGTSITGNTLAVSITNSGAWVPGTNYVANASNFPAVQVSYQTAVQTYSSEFAGSNCTFTLQRYIPTANFVRVSFSGVIKNADNTATVNLQNGVFMQDLP